MSYFLRDIKLLLVELEVSENKEIIFEKLLKELEYLEIYYGNSCMHDVFEELAKTTHNKYLHESEKSSKY